MRLWPERAVTTVMGAVTRVRLGAGDGGREGGGGGGWPVMGGARGRDIDGQGRGRVGAVHVAH